MGQQASVRFSPLSCGHLAGYSDLRSSSVDPVGIFKFRAVMSSAMVQAHTHEPPRKLVFRGLANFREEDLRSLNSILARRALERALLRWGASERNSECCQPSRSSLSSL